MLDFNFGDYINHGELSDLLAGFDDRLSYGSGELIGQFLNSGEFDFISILLKKGPNDQDPYEVHGHLNIDDRYSPLLGAEKVGVCSTIKQCLNEWGYLEQMKDLGFDLGEDFKVISESVYYNKSFFHPPHSMGFYTQANLFIEKANTRALNLIAEILKTGFRCAEITEVLYADKSNPQINLNINDQLGTGSSNVNFDEELLYIVGEILQADREAIVSLQWQDMNDEFFGARIYGNAPIANGNTPSLLNFKNWDRDILDKDDEFYLDEITDSQQQFLQPRIKIFTDLAGDKDFETYENVIDVIRENPLPSPDVDIHYKGSEQCSGTDYGNADEETVEWIIDTIQTATLNLLNIGAVQPIGKGSFITLILQELAPDPDSDGVVYGFSAYKLTLSSNLDLIIVIYSEGEMDEERYVSYDNLRFNLIDPKTQDRGISSELYAELKNEFLNK